MWAPMAPQQTRGSASVVASGVSWPLHRTPQAQRAKALEQDAQMMQKPRFQAQRAQTLEQAAQMMQSKPQPWTSATRMTCPQSELTDGRSLQSRS